MKSTAHIRRLWAFSLLAFSAACLSTAGQAQSQIQSIDGLWDATVTVNNVPIPFRIELSSNGTEVTSYFFNGDERVSPSTQGSFRDGLLDLKFASYATELKATFNDGTGEVDRLLSGWTGKRVSLPGEAAQSVVNTCRRFQSTAHRWPLGDPGEESRGRVSMALYREAIGF